ncbi:chemotaxis protein CheW [Anaeromyxobacter sp. Fw109-5]|uniref:chemotaxis protein CheW n=1 Tax=Anaeromyxobacter sp. (strain Fw109-5) TaxID=404589 RepID=UPI0000ED7E3E|nr:chemotaxis protein CheW [Anaeromyxobacter sp. Fw109-5]
MAGHRIMASVGSLASDGKALIFSAGGVRLALRLSHVRELLAVPPDAGEVSVRGEPVPTAFVSTVLGLPAGPSPYALLTEDPARAALRVEALHGIVDLAEAEVFQLPARTPLPQPAPFAGAIVARGELALELAVSTLGFAPLEPAEELPEPPPDAALGAGAERELRFARGGRTYAVPLSLLVQILEAPEVARVPLTPQSHRGLLHHARALHPVVDVGVLYGDAPGEGRTVLLVDAGGAGVGVVADRVLGVAEGEAEVTRPPWDALFGV